MTPTPTPLRELPAKWRERAKLCQPESAQTMQICAAELEAALSARDEAGAVDCVRSMLADWKAEVAAERNVSEAERDHQFISVREHDIRRLESAIATPHASGEAGAYPTSSDREVLRYLMQQFDAESWECPRCGHSEDCATMDSADYLRRYLATPPAASGDDLASLVKSRLFRQFMDQGFWHAHHVDLVWRYNGQDVREEADWLKDLWYAIRRLAAVAPEGMDDGYYIASFKNGRSGDGTVLWWMPDNAGYSSDLEQAGIYRDLMPGYHDNEYTVPVPVSFIRNLRVRRVVDCGDSLNTAFHSAKSLRAILAAAAPTPPATAGQE